LAKYVGLILHQTEQPTLKPDSRVRDISALSDGVFYRGFPPPELLFPSAISFHVDDIVESSNGVSTIFLTEL
jgi:hypothetical protein